MQLSKLLLLLLELLLLLLCIEYYYCYYCWLLLFVCIFNFFFFLLTRFYMMGISRVFLYIYKHIVINTNGQYIVPYMGFCCYNPLPNSQKPKTKAKQQTNLPINLEIIIIITFICFCIFTSVVLIVNKKKIFDCFKQKKKLCQYKFI